MLIISDWLQESKRFYLDVKENSRGRFIKMAEISADGRKNQIMMTIPTAAQFRQHLVIKKLPVFIPNKYL